MKKKSNKRHLENELFSSILDILYKRKTTEDELIRPILPLKEWVTDQYYVGSDGISLYPFWIQVMCDIFGEERDVNLVVLSGGIGCRPLTSTIQTSIGNLNLYELKENIKDKDIYVLTESGNEKISGIHFIGNKDTKRLKLSNGLVYEVTSNHLLRALSNGNIVWMRADELSIGDSILCSSKCSLFPNKKNRYEEYAYLLGQHIVDIEGNSARLNESIEGILYCIKYFSKDGICRLIAGIFDSIADFHINENSILEIRLTLKSSRLLDFVQRILLNLGILCSIGNETKICSGDVTEYSLTINSFHSQELFSDIIPLKDMPKKERLYNFIKTKGSFGFSGGSHELFTNFDSFDNETLEYLVDNDCYSLRITDIEDSECECGDIEVCGSHTYISNGIINHNTGKSTCGLFMMVRMLYELSCHKSIHKYLKLKMESALIVFLYFSLSKFVAKRTGFKQFRELIDSIPYFRDNFPTDPKSKDEVRFPNNVYFLYGTGTGDAIGSNMLCSLLDEANFFSNSSGESSDFNKVAELHRALVARQASRFMKNGENKSLSIVVSSATFKSSYTEELRKKSLTDHTVRFYRARKWDIEPQGTYSTSEFFYVYCGDDKVDPFIIEEASDICSRLGLDISGSSVKEAIDNLPIEYRSLVDEIPIDFKPQYEVNIVKSLQDFSGYSTESTNMLFSNKTVFNSCIDDTIPELFFSNQFTIETGNNSPSNNISYYMKDIHFINPSKPRYIHVDLGITNDACGIACCHKGDEVEVDGVKHDVYVFDFTLRIVPPQPPKKMSITRVEEFIIYLRDKLNLTIGMVSYDNFQSAGSLQRLGDLGFNVRLQSVDRDDKAYLYFVENLYLRTVKFNQTFASSIEHELFNLIHYRDKHKVDHPSDTKHGGMKDRMDSVVGSLYNAFEDKTVRVNLEDNMNLSSYNIEHDIQDDYLKGMNRYDY